MKLFDPNQTRTQRVILLAYAGVMFYRTYKVGREVVTILKEDRHRRKVARFIATDPFLNDTWQGDTVAGVEPVHLRYVSFDPSFDTMSPTALDDEFIQTVVNMVHEADGERMIQGTMDRFECTHSFAEVALELYFNGDAITGWTPKPNPYGPGTPSHDRWAQMQDALSF